MTSFVCTTCGTAFPDSATPPQNCPICSEERQFVPVGGQTWTTHERLAATHRNAWRRHEPDLFSLHTVPAFAINQRAFVLRLPGGNVLWDCVALLDAATEDLVHALGGLRAIAISHPHYYTRMVDWARAFDCPIHLHADDRRWIVRPDPAIRPFEGETLEIAPGATLVRLGGHFEGGCVLHWADGAAGAGVLLCGDVVQVAADRSKVSFLWSYPNMLPLPARSIRRIATTLDPWRFVRLYGAFDGQDVLADAKGVVARSAARYIALVEDAGDAR